MGGITSKFLNRCILIKKYVKRRKWNEIKGSSINSLYLFGGKLGIDRFYLGYIGTGILKLITCGGFGIWWLIDLIMIATGKLKPKDGSEYAE